MSGVILGCVVEVSGARHCWVWLLVLKAGPSALETDSMLIIVDAVVGSSTRWDRQSAALLLAPDIHSNEMSLSIYLVICILSIQELCEWFVIISDYDVCTLEIVI